MATSRINIGNKFKNADIPSENDFEEIFDSFVHKDEDKANFQMVETGTDDQHYVTPALLRTGLQNIGIITGNSYMPVKEHFDSFIGNTLPLEKLPVKFSVKAFKNGQLLLEKENETDEGDYIINYDTAVITFSSNIDKRNIEVDYWYKNLTPNPGGGSGQQIDFGSFLHTSGNETKNGILTFNNTTPNPTSGIVLTNSGTDAGAKVLDVTVSGAGSGVSVQNTATGTGIKLSNTGAGVGVSLNSTATATGDALQVSKDNVVKAKIDKDGNVTASKFVTSDGTEDKFVKGDGSLDDTVYAEDTKVIHTTGNESRDGALNLTHNDAVQDVLTITKNNSANCLKLVQNSSSNATTSTFDTGSDDVNRKAISVQKKTVEKAFITHDGNLSGTSFTTLNEKADITDGFLTLGDSTTPTPMADHAKLYAKKDGSNTDMYVMGSDGVEKKIGGAVDLSAYAKTASPALTGIPTAPTAAVGANSTQVATTAFVTRANGNYVDKTTDQTIGGLKTFSHQYTIFNTVATGSLNVSSSASIGTSIDFSNPPFGLAYGNSTGNPTIGRINNSIGIYSGGTNFVAELITSSITGGHKAYTFPNKSGTFALTSDLQSQGNFLATTTPTATAGMAKIYAKTTTGTDMYVMGSDGVEIKLGGSATDLSSYAKLASPNLTGIPTAPTAVIGTNTNQLATTAFVMANGGGATSGSYNAVVSNMSGISGTPTVLKSVYTKIGNLITVTCRVSLVNDASGDFLVPDTRVIFISLPFQAVGDSSSVTVSGTNNDGPGNFGSIIGGGDGNNGTKAVLNYKGTKSSPNQLVFTITYNI